MTKNTNAPERIVASMSGIGCHRSWHSKGYNDLFNNTEYIRADLHEALQAENAKLKLDNERMHEALVATITDEVLAAARGETEKDTDR